MPRRLMKDGFFAASDLLLQERVPQVVRPVETEALESQPMRENIAEADESSLGRFARRPGLIMSGAMAQQRKRRRYRQSRQHRLMVTLGRPEAAGDRRPPPETGRKTWSKADCTSGRSANDLLSRDVPSSHSSMAIVESPVFQKSCRAVTAYGAARGRPFRGIGEAKNAMQAMMQ